VLRMVPLAPFLGGDCLPSVLDLEGAADTGAGASGASNDGVVRGCFEELRGVDPADTESTGVGLLRAVILFCLCTLNSSTRFTSSSS
jgi:hypothetical protein